MSAKRVWGTAVVAALALCNGAMAQNIWTGTSVPTTTSGKVGIGTTNPQAELHLVGGIQINHPSNTNKTLFLGYNVSGDYSFVSSWDWGSSTWRNLVLNAGGGNVGVGTVTPARKLDIVGTTRTTVLEITGGSDLAEPFRVAGAMAEPGMVMSIDPQRPGHLRVASTPYDRTVAGVVSGAGGVRPGMVMGQAGSIADGDVPVALSGRVFVLADASAAPIEPGDLLTTSAVPGYAMKAVDAAQSQGAVLGKAMTGLASGRGQVLVLVSLQ